MGSKLGPKLANIRMTALEDDIIRPLATSDTPKFHRRSVNDTPLSAKPNDIPMIPEKLNSFHAHLRNFTYRKSTQALFKFHSMITKHSTEPHSPPTCPQDLQYTTQIRNS